MKTAEKFSSKTLASSVTSPSDDNSFIIKTVSITAVICVILISLALAMLKSMPKEAVLSAFSKDKPADAPVKITSYIYPKPSEDIRTKADRLKEIRYEEYLEKCYKPKDGEMDNVYIYDNKKKCYLTFDDGPSDVTRSILDVLNGYGVKATFFVMGQRAEANPKMIKEILSGGHSIGNHSYSHDYNMVYGSVQSFKNEVKKCRDAIEGAIGTKYDNLVFRFPGGYESLTDEDTKAAYRMALKGMGYKYIDWTCLTGDSETTDPTEQYLMDTLKMTVGHTVTGDIVVLMHDSATKEMTANTLPKVIEYLHNEGYEFDKMENKK